VVLARDFPEVLALQDQLAGIDNDLGLVHAALGQGKEAIESYGQARECWERLAAAHPEQVEIASHLGGLYCNLGMVEAETLGHPKAGLAWVNRAVEKLAEVLKRVPASAKARTYLVNAYRTRALALSSLGRSAEGRVDLDRALEIAPVSEKDGLRLTRALILARLGEYALAESEARALAHAPRLPAGPAAYDLACVYAVASAAAAADRRLTELERSARTDDLAALALGELRRAHAAGFFGDPATLDHLDHDGDLAPLRLRSDYRILRLDLAFPINPFATRR